MQENKTIVKKNKCIYSYIEREQAINRDLAHNYHLD